LNSSASDKSTVFTVFGIDSSGVYNSEPATPDPELTLDMLSVDEKKNIVVISKSYLDELAKAICSSFGFNQEYTETFLNEYKGTGEYSPEGKKLTIEIKFKHDTLGSIIQKNTLKIDKDQKVSVVNSFYYDNPILGLDRPIQYQISYNDVVFQDKTPVSATIIMSMNTPAPNYYSRDSASWISDIVKFTIDVSDKSAPKADASLDRTTYRGEFITGRKECKLSIDLGKTDSQFSFGHYWYIDDQNKLCYTSITANKISFSTPEQFEAVPQSVTNAINSFWGNQ
jgi:hypothetical protein